jgi:hypothetical protein
MRQDTRIPMCETSRHTHMPRVNTHKSAYMPPGKIWVGRRYISTGHASGSMQKQICNYRKGFFAVHPYYTAKATFYTATSLPCTRARQRTDGKAWLGKESLSCAGPNLHGKARCRSSRHPHGKDPRCRLPIFCRAPRIISGSALKS